VPWHSDRHGDTRHAPLSRSARRACLQLCAAHIGMEQQQSHRTERVLGTLSRGLPTHQCVERDDPRHTEAAGPAGCAVGRRSRSCIAWSCVGCLPAGCSCAAGAARPYGQLFQDCVGPHGLWQAGELPNDGCSRRLREHISDCTAGGPAVDAACVEQRPGEGGGAAGESQLDCSAWPVAAALLFSTCTCAASSSCYSTYRGPAGCVRSTRTRR
jgi:hypothetical protein